MAGRVSPRGPGRRWTAWPRPVGPGHAVIRRISGGDPKGRRPSNGPRVTRLRLPARRGNYCPVRAHSLALPAKPCHSRGTRRTEMRTAAVIPAPAAQGVPRYVPLTTEPAASANEYGAVPLDNFSSLQRKDLRQEPVGRVPDQGSWRRRPAGRASSAPWRRQIERRATGVPGTPLGRSIPWRDRRPDADSAG